MKPISAALKSHLTSDVTSLAYLWKITRRDGTVLGFTDHDADLTYDTVTYRAASGFTPTAVDTSGALNVDNMDLEGMLSNDAIRDQDVRAGLYDFAQVELSLVNYRDLSQGDLNLRTGWLGEVTLQDGAFVAEVRGLTQAFSQRIGESYSKTCRASLGDGRCKVDLPSVTVSGTVTSANGSLSLTDSARTEANGHFNYGKMTFTSGANQGVEMEVKEYRNKEFVMSLPLPYPLAIGDGYSVHVGCDRRFFTCVNRFSNAANFRGEPHVPGIDTILETSSTRNT